MHVDTVIGEAMQIFQTNGFAQYPVVDRDDNVCGVVTKKELMKQLVKQRVTLEDPVSKVT